ncbi:MAG: 5-bromo-4-chloroindolyl phosphate hydrolysis family protein [Eubacteriales bacterium]|jgi:hypothetical protein|nr:hypothetical protein [Clostridiales bacterium]
MNNNQYKSAFSQNRPDLEYTLKRKRSPVPFFATVGFLALYGIITAFSAWFHFLIAGGGAMVLHGVTKRLFPPVEVKVPRKRELPSSGNSETDKLLAAGESHLKSAEASMTKIASFNRNFAGEIAPVLACAYKINSYIAENPEQRQMLRRHFSYYLPQLDKLLRAYLTFHRHGMGGKNAVTAMREIEDAVRAMYNAFSSQLDKLLYDKTLDITTDIDVLESMLSETAGGAKADKTLGTGK